MAEFQDGYLAQKGADLVIGVRLIPQRVFFTPASDQLIRLADHFKGFLTFYGLP